MNDMSLSTQAAKGMMEYEHNAMTQNMGQRFNDIDIWIKSDL